MTDTPVWPAPAKLNLFLHVTGQRADGYHELQTAFQFLDFGDRLSFRVVEGGAIRISGHQAARPEDDLTVRAARCLQAYTGGQYGAEIRLSKRIPVGGGLGGGSSDAATALVALNELWAVGLSVDELAGLGVELGADVPVFVRGLASWGEGVGDRLEPVTLAEPWYLVVTPPCRVSTREIFADPHLTRNTKPIRISDLFSGGLRNDCEPVATRLYPEIGAALDWLAGYGQARMTGTGACVFAAFPDQDAAEHALAELPDRWQGFVARGLNRSPLLTALADPRIAGRLEDSAVDPANASD